MELTSAIMILRVMCHRRLYNVDGSSNKSADRNHNTVTMVVLIVGDVIEENSNNDRNRDRIITMMKKLQQYQPIFTK